MGCLISIPTKGDFPTSVEGADHAHSSVRHLAVATNTTASRQLERGRHSSRSSSPSSARSSWSSSHGDTTNSTLGSAGPQNMPNEMELAKRRLQGHVIARSNSAPSSPIRTIRLRRLQSLSLQQQQEDKTDEDSSGDCGDDDDDDEQFAVPSDDDIRRAEDLIQVANANRFFQHPHPPLADEHHSIGEDEDGWTTGTDSDSDTVDVDEDDDVRLPRFTDSNKVSEPSGDDVQHKSMPTSCCQSGASDYCNNDAHLEQVPPVLESRPKETGVCDARNDEGDKPAWLDINSPPPSRRAFTDYYQGADPKGPESPFLVKHGRLQANPRKERDNIRAAFDMDASRVQALPMVTATQQLKGGGQPPDDDDDDAALCWLSATLAKKRKRKPPRSNDTIRGGTSMSSQALSLTLNTSPDDNGKGCLLAARPRSDPSLPESDYALILPVDNLRSSKSNITRAPKAEKKPPKKEKKRSKQVMKKDKKSKLATGIDSNTDEEHVPRADGKAPLESPQDQNLPSTAPRRKRKSSTAKKAKRENAGGKETKKKSKKTNKRETSNERA